MLYFNRNTEFCANIRYLSKQEANVFERNLFVSSEPALHKNSPQHNSTRSPAHSWQLHTEYGSRTTKSKYSSDCVSLLILFNWQIRFFRDLKISLFTRYTLLTQFWEKRIKRIADNTTRSYSVCVCSCVSGRWRPGAGLPTDLSAETLQQCLGLHQRGLQACSAQPMTSHAQWSHGPPFLSDCV